MKSTSAQLGATTLADLAADAERLALRGELEGVSPLLDAAEAELARYAAWLDSAARAGDSP